MARILTLDIETAPMQAAVWGMWKQNISVKMMKEAGYILCYSAKWLNDDVVLYDDGRGGKKDTDAPRKMHEKLLLETLIPLLDEADMVVGHNLTKFDMSKIRGRCLVHRLPIPSPYKEIDTCAAARREFGFESNSLEFLSEVLQIKHRKSDHSLFPGYKLWAECLAGNPDAWKSMQDYNVVDIRTTEDLYLVMRPYMRQHPNVNVMDEDIAVSCTKCGSHKIIKDGYAYTNAGKYQAYSCKSCGGWSRSRYTINTVEKRKSLLTNMVN
jgi:hypothetical protein